jgi:anthranilate synthase component 1
MVYPSLADFLPLTQKGNFVPVYQEWVADLETPVSAWYRVCAEQSYSFLLESVEGGERVGRYSFLGCNPLWILTVRGNQITQTYRNGATRSWTGNPFSVLKTCLESYHPVHLAPLPQSIGGLFGYWGYELIHWIEPTVPIYEATEATDPPDAIFMQMDCILIFDQVKRKIWVVAFADLQQFSPELAYEKAVTQVEHVLAQLSTALSPIRLPWQLEPATDLPFQSSMTQEHFCQQVDRAKRYIKAGDIFQVVLSQRFQMNYVGDPFFVYRSLRLINPSPYMAFFRFGGFCLVGSSPEVMVKLNLEGEHRIAIVRPIAGTRPRGETLALDLALEEELLADPKERAEHIMLVDLGRNDLGRVCDLGSVRVTSLMQIERYSHVMHIVSNVEGHLDPTKTAWDLLQASFPAGTVTGAPKIRAMQIIHELEGIRRGPYSGAYGYYDFTGQLNTAITIRTLWLQGEQVILQAGAGIVADSDPEQEYQECLNKARGLLTALASLRNS